MQLYLIQIIKGYTHKMESILIPDSLVSIICHTKDLLYMCVYIYVCVCIYVHIYVYVYTHTYK